MSHNIRNRLAAFARFAPFVLALTLVPLWAFSRAGAQDGTRLAVARPETETSVAIVRLDVPVAWQLTRVRSAASGSTTMTESFSETWTIEQRPLGSFLLQSPRGRVEAFASGVRDTPQAWPKTLLLPEDAFARLVGIRVDGDGDENNKAAPLAKDRFVTLTVGPMGRGSSDVMIRLTEDEHYEVHVELGTQKNLF